jgi:hypothetical protein
MESSSLSLLRCCMISTLAAAMRLVGYWRIRDVLLGLIFVFLPHDGGGDHGAERGPPRTSAGGDAASRQTRAPRWAPGKMRIRHPSLR